MIEISCDICQKKPHTFELTNHATGDAICKACAPFAEEFLAGRNDIIQKSRAREKAQISQYRADFFKLKVEGQKLKVAK